MAMRAQVRGASSAPEQFDVKRSIGGMVDAEFAMQFLVLSQSAAHPTGRQRRQHCLMVRAEKAGLVPPGIGTAAADAYRDLRRIQHRARLNEEPTQVLPETLATDATP